MDHKQAAITILGAVGGVKNIISAQHCATRLRLVLRTAELANDNAIRAVPGVLDVVRADGQYQIVIGPDVVNVFSALLALPGFDAVAACDAETDAPDFSPSDTQEKRKVPLWRSAQRAFISTLAAIIVPVVPALTAAGSLRALLMLLTALGLTAAWRPYYQVLFGLCNLPFRFLPILFAYTAARRFHAVYGRLRACHPRAGRCLYAGPAARLNRLKNDQQRGLSAKHSACHRGGLVHQRGGPSGRKIQPANP